MDRGLVLKTMGCAIRIITSDITTIDLIHAFSKMMITVKVGVSAFVEGLSTGNSFFVEILILALHITLVSIGQQKSVRSPEYLARAIDFTALLKEENLYSVASAAARFAFSNLCLNLVYHKNEHVSENYRLNALAEAAAALISAISTYNKPQTEKSSCLSSGAMTLPARGRNVYLDIFSDLVSESAPLTESIADDASFATREPNPKQPPLEEVVMRIAAAQKPQNLEEAIRSSKTATTVRVLGMGQREGVIPVNECLGLPSSDMLDSIPIAAASTVIDALGQENPQLLFQLHNAASPHRHFRNPFLSTSYILNLARKLSKGLLSFRQFQNNFFSPKKEAHLMSETFANVKSVMARDDRLDGLCEKRVNSVMGASYIKVRKKPECLFITKLLNPVLRRHVACEEDTEEECELNDAKTSTRREMTLKMGTI